METKPMTVNDVLNDVKTILGNISVPVSMIESIGIPIAKSINGIKLCLDTFRAEDEARAQVEAEKAAQEQQAEVIDLGEIGGEEDA